MLVSRRCVTFLWCQRSKAPAHTDHFVCRLSAVLCFAGTICGVGHCMVNWRTLLKPDRLQTWHTDSHYYVDIPINQQVRGPRSRSFGNSLPPGASVFHKRVLFPYVLSARWNLISMKSISLITHISQHYIIFVWTVPMTRPLQKWAFRSLFQSWPWP